MNRKRKILAGALTAALLLTLSIPAFATSGDVAGAVEQTWTSAQGQIKTVVNNVVFPVLDVILAVLFFVRSSKNFYSAAQNRKTSRVLRKRMNCLSEFCLEVFQTSISLRETSKHRGRSDRFRIFSASFTSRSE